MSNETKSRRTAERALRLQGALRENLRRRKEQARGRASPQGPRPAEDEAAAEAGQPSGPAKPRTPG